MNDLRALARIVAFFTFALPIFSARAEGPAVAVPKTDDARSQAPLGNAVPDAPRPSHLGANPAAERQRRHSHAERGDEWVGPLHAEKADYKIIFWYNRSRPVETLQHEVYDVRKGQFTPAVEAWLRKVNVEYPAYMAYARDVDLARTPGATEPLKVGRVILDELDILVGAQGITPGALEAQGITAGAFGAQGITAGAIRSASPFSNEPRGPGYVAPLPFPGSRYRPMYGPPPYLFPTPYPYPRPHP